MFRSRWLRVLIGAVLLLPLGAARAQDVIISEFLASNDRTLRDDDGDFSDWIELYNPGDTPVNMLGWFITDNAGKLTKWRFPNVTIAPRGFLVIFASDKNRTNPSKPLHTSFALSAEGEYLGLVKPDGRTITSEYAPAFPPQQTDVSYGIVFEGNATTLIASGAPARAIVPTSGVLGTSWLAPAFNDSAWVSGSTGVGYERWSGYEALIGLDLNTRMYNKNTSAYIRIPFNVSDLSAVERMTLRMKYDDGFAAYLNGQFIASANTPGQMAWNSAAPTINPDEYAVQFADFDVTAHVPSLLPGANVLAIHGLNDSLRSSDFLILPELVGFYGSGILPDMRRSFSVPTPGAPNGLVKDQGPMISEIVHTPNVPNAGQNLQVTARVEPAGSPVETVSLTYRVMFGPESTVPMYDDGTHGDGAAGDGVFGAAIPAGAYSSGQMVRYFVRATGANNHTSRFPLFVNSTNAAEYLGTIVADPAVVTPLPVLYWFVQDPNAAITRTGTRASVFYNGRFYDNIFVRLRGNSSIYWPKKNLKFDFNAGAYFHYDPNVSAVEEFNLQSTYSDKSYMRQVLSWETYAAAGVPGSRSFHMRVQQNGNFYSVAEWVEQPDERMLTRNGLDPDGALYKMENTLDRADGGFEKKTRLQEDFSDLQALVTGVNSPTGSALTNYMFDNVDIPEAINYMAATTIIHDNDHPHKNYYVYRDTEGSGEWGFLPWDKDLTFGRNFTNEGGVLNDTIWSQYDPPSHPFFASRNYPKVDGFWNRFIDALIREPTIRRMYVRRLRTLMEDLLQPPGTPYADLKFENRMDELADLIRDDAAVDFTKWPTYGQPQSTDTAVSVMKIYYLANRRTHLFNTHGGPGKLIPPAAPEPVNLVIGAMERSPASGNDAEQYIRLDNPTAVDADISGWSLLGEVRHTFRPGTVVPAYGSLYVSPDVRAFRSRAASPTGGMGLFVQGNYRGRMEVSPRPLQLRTDTGALIAYTGYGMGDALSALRVAAGLTAADPEDVSLLDFASEGDSASVVDLADAIRLIQMAAAMPQ